MTALIKRATPATWLAVLGSVVIAAVIAGVLVVGDPTIVPFRYLVLGLVLGLLLVPAMRRYAGLFLAVFIASVALTALGLEVRKPPAPAAPETESRAIFEVETCRIALTDDIAEGAAVTVVFVMPVAGPSAGTPATTTSTADATADTAISPTPDRCGAQEETTGDSTVVLLSVKQGEDALAVSTFAQGLETALRIYVVPKPDS